MLVVALVALVEVLTFSGTYLLHSRHYVSVDNAQVDGDKIEINAPSTGTLTNWSITRGSTVRENQIVGDPGSGRRGILIVQMSAMNPFCIHPTTG